MVTTIATNTLIIPDIPKVFLTSTAALETIRSQCAAFGTLHQFIPMKSFGRLMVIYCETQRALAAKTAMDRAHVYWTEQHGESLILGWNDHVFQERDMRLPVYDLPIRVYFGQHNPIDPDRSRLSLQVPDPGKNFLISPPGEPCDAWRSREESPPNKAVMASDLLRALTMVDADEDGDHAMDDASSLNNFRLEDDDDADGDTCMMPSVELHSPNDNPSSNHSEVATPTLQLSFDHDYLELPTIRIQDMDGTVLAQHEQKLGKTQTQRPPPTARPPIFNH
ncbi:Calcipressin-domain-containing protein [Gongronella butleri]|nr:Calcipressin-domain-containing protein [Gongronella butleri]